MKQPAVSYSKLRIITALPPPTIRTFYFRVKTRMNPAHHLKTYWVQIHNTDSFRAVSQVLNTFRMNHEIIITEMDENHWKLWREHRSHTTPLEKTI